MLPLRSRPRRCHCVVETPARKTAAVRRVTRRTSLLIATDYEDAHRLTGCEADARRMNAALMARGYPSGRMLLGAAVTPAAVLQSIREVLRRSDRLDEVFIFFSGHGSQLPASDAAEVDGFDEAIVCHALQCVRDNDIRAELQRCAPGCSLVCVFDCCHSGTITDAPRFRRLATEHVRPHRLTIAACRDEQLAAQVSGRGALTDLILDCLVNDDEGTLSSLRGRVIAGGQVTTLSGHAGHGRLLLH